MKRFNQKLKAFLIYQYLMENTDENNCLATTDILDFLETDMGIKAERRSLYTDIDEINKTLYALREGISLERAEFEIEEKKNDKWKTIVYDGSKKKYYVRKRDYKLNDVNAIVECIYAARFITEAQAEKYVDIITRNLVSIHQADEIQHEALLLDRGKTINPQVFENVQKIYKAMRVKAGKEKHIPEKISFKYVAAAPKGKTKEFRKGERYIVSPFKIIINDGNYYLLAFDDKNAAARTFRVDRMKEIKALGIPRESMDEMFSIDETAYVKQHFGMYGGKVERVTLRFINKLLDTVYDKFGRENLYYTQVDDRHFTIQVEVAITDQFFGWLCGLGKQVKIVSPPPIQEKYKEHLEKIKDMY